MSIRDSFWFKFLREHIRRIQCRINPEKEVDRCYFSVFHKHWNSKNPKDLIEKIYWLELHTDTSLWSKCTDKFRVREYIKDLGLINYMPKLYGQWDCIKDIDFEKLPNSFVIKSNNGCATVKVIKDKSKINLKAQKRELWEWLHLPFGADNAQFHYWAIKPCIIAEELLPNDYETLSPQSLVDFKVYCINGKPQFIWVAYNRVNMHVHVQCYDTEWNPRPDYMVNTMSHYVYDPTDIPIEKPLCLEEMLSVASKISASFPQLRADFYIVNGKPVIGEMTFSQGYGFLKMEVYEKLGEMIDLSKLDRSDT
jgi:hypothetical protein